MTKARRILAAAALLGVITLTGFAQKAPDLCGTWIGKTEVPNVGTIEVTLVLKKAEKRYGGTISSDNQAVINANTEIRDATIDGENLSFIFPLAEGTLLMIKQIVDGDKMTGHWEHPAGTTGAIELVKKK
ncbi:MAG: hypothetical protein OEW18_00290 [Candidatus Aminicenantes bacterium]|nr:hypothetical protein [Candidatus Aminicenantes bacterium]